MQAQTANEQTSQQLQKLQQQHQWMLVFIFFLVLLILSHMLTLWVLPACAILLLAAWQYCPPEILGKHAAPAPALSQMPHLPAYHMPMEVVSPFSQVAQPATPMSVQSSLDPASSISSLSPEPHGRYLLPLCQQCTCPGIADAIYKMPAQRSFAI